MSLQSCLLSQEARHPPSPPYLTLRDGSLIIVQNVCCRNRTKSPPTPQASLATPATHGFCLARQAPLARLMDADRGEGGTEGRLCRSYSLDQVPCRLLSSPEPGTLALQGPGQPFPLWPPRTLELLTQQGLEEITVQHCKEGRCPPQ